MNEQKREVAYRAGEGINFSDLEKPTDRKLPDFSIRNFEEHESAATLETEQFKVAYSREMGELLRNNPETINNALDLTMKADLTGTGKPVENSSARITLKHVQLNSYSYKVELQGHSFFLKRELKDRDSYKQFLDTFEAKKRFENTPWVTVIEPQLAYTDKKGVDILMTDWQDLTPLHEHMGEQLTEEESDNIAEKLRYIYDTLPDYTGDLTPRNMFYDPDKKQIYLFDLTKKDSK